MTGKNPGQSSQLTFACSESTTETLEHILTLNIFYIFLEFLLLTVNR